MTGSMQPKWLHARFVFASTAALTALLLLPVATAALGQFPARDRDPLAADRAKFEAESKKTQEAYERYKITRDNDKQVQLRKLGEMRSEVDHLFALVANRRDEVKRLAAELEAKRDALTETVADLRVARERLANMERLASAVAK